MLRGSAGGFILEFDNSLGLSKEDVGVPYGFKKLIQMKIRLATLSLISNSPVLY